MLLSFSWQRTKKRPLPADRGRSKSRYHLIFAMPSRTWPRRVLTHPAAVTGGPDTSLHAQRLQEAAPGCIHRLRPVLLAPSGGSLCRRRSVLLLPFITVALSSCHYFSRNSPFVNYHFTETGALASTHGSTKLFRLSQQFLRPIQYGLGHVAAAGKPGQLLTALRICWPRRKISAIPYDAGYFFVL